MPDEVFSEQFHDKWRLKMDDPFYTACNYILLEACEMANLDLKDITHINRDKIGICISNLGEPLQNMLRLKLLRGGRLMTVTNFGITGALALEHGIHGHQGMNGNGCAASCYSIGDSYRMIKNGYLDIIFSGGIDTNVGNFSHHILDAVGALNPNIGKEHSTACKPFDEERLGTV